MPPHPAVVLITGIQAAGKSTVAQALAERLPRSVHVRGHLFHRMIVSGRVDVTPDLLDALSGAGLPRHSPAPGSGEAPDLALEAMRQLRLRYELAASVTDRYVRAGFSVVVQDILLEQELPRMTELIRSRPLFVVVLIPDPATIAARERERGANTYQEWTIAQLDESLRHRTPRIGLWLDTSAQTVEQTVAEIMGRAWTEAAVA